MTTKITARAARRGREQRRVPMPAMEIRTAADGGTDAALTGYACVTDSGYTIPDLFGDYTEIVRPGAFRDTLAAADDVRLLINHDGIALARTKSGTLQLREITDPATDPLEQGTTGLWVEANLDPASTIVADIRSAMGRGDLDEMSFAFQVTDQEWSPDYTQRDIKALKLFDVSVVTYPANPATSASMRSLTDQIDDMTDDELRSAIARMERRLSTPDKGALSYYRAQAQALALRK